MACARCGCGVYQTEDIITLNKIWHKCCFTCYKCRKRLDKCTAKVFQGEVFCDRCYKCLLQRLELLSPPSKPCRVASSPSCTCGKGNAKPVKILPPLDKSKKYQICLLTNQQVKIVKSCSCIPDKKSNIDKKELYCLAFPLPREVANYYNRMHAIPKQNQKPTNCYCAENTRHRSKKPDNTQRFAKIRSLSQQPPCPICQKNYRSSPSPQSSPQCCKCPSINESPPSIRCPSQPSDCRCPPQPPDCRYPPLPPCCRCSRVPRPCRCSPQLPGCRCPPQSQRYSSESQERYLLEAEDPPPPSVQCCCASPPPPPPPPQREKCYCPKCCPPPRCKVHSPPTNLPSPKTSRSPQTRKLCPVCCHDTNTKPEPAKKSSYRCCVSLEDDLPPCVCKMPKYCPCGNLNPCSCKMCQVRAICTPTCNRCGYKVYAAEKISVSKGAFHTGCFSCFCCRKPLDVTNFYESCGEIYCKQCYNNLNGNQFYGYGSSHLC